MDAIVGGGTAAEPEGPVELRAQPASGRPARTRTTANCFICHPDPAALAPVLSLARVAGVFESLWNAPNREAIERGSVTGVVRWDGICGLFYGNQVPSRIEEEPGSHEAGSGERVAKAAAGADEGNTRAGARGGRMAPCVQDRRLVVGALIVRAVFGERPGRTLAGRRLDRLIFALCAACRKNDSKNEGARFSLSHHAYLLNKIGPTPLVSTGKSPHPSIGENLARSDNKWGG